MYAIIHKNRVLVGPKDWNRAFFTFALKQVKVLNPLIPRKPSDDILPLAIDADTKIVKAEVTKDSFDPMTQGLSGPHYIIEQDRVIAEYRATDMPIESARQKFKDQAADERYKKEIAGAKATIQEIEVTIDTNRGARDIFVQKYLLMNDTETVGWKFPEAWLNLTKAELGQVVQAGAQHVQGCFDWELNIGKQIDLAQNAEELHAIEIVKKPEVPELQQPVTE